MKRTLFLQSAALLALLCLGVRCGLAEPDEDHVFNEIDWSTMADGSLLDALDPFQKWYVAEVRKLIHGPNGNINSVYIHYISWSARWDEWINAEDFSERLAPRGTHTKLDDVNLDGHWRSSYKGEHIVVDGHNYTVYEADGRLRSQGVFHYAKKWMGTNRTGDNFASSLAMEKFVMKARSDDGNHVEWSLSDETDGGEADLTWTRIAEANDASRTSATEMHQVQGALPIHNKVAINANGTDTGILIHTSVAIIIIVLALLALYYIASLYKLRRLLKHQGRLD